MKRFDRQVILPELGLEGQEKLSKAKVLVVGAGGLGSPILQYLAAAGVGNIGIIDGDVVEESNLNRQVLFGYGDLGKNKADKAVAILGRVYPDIVFHAFSEYLNQENAFHILSQYDLILDGTDNFGTRYLINDACVLLGKPFILGAIYKFEGQVAVFNAGESGVNYRDLHPVQPGGHEIPNCSETGVLGTLPGLIGTLQATEALKYLTGIGDLLVGRMLYYDMRTVNFFQVSVTPSLDGRSQLPKTESEFLEREYHVPEKPPARIGWREAIIGLERQKHTLIDIRNPDEEPVVAMEAILRIPLKELQEQPELLEEVKRIVLFCQTGRRSDRMVQILKKKFPDKLVFSVEGGILDSNASLLKNYEEKTQKHFH